MCGTAVAVDGQESFHFRTKRSIDRVEATGNHDATTFSVHSPMGIGEAVIARTSATWPDRVVMKLYLKGLESFQVSNGKVTLHAAVSSQSEIQSVRIWKEGDESVLLDRDDPCWITIRLIGVADHLLTAVPLENGNFELQLPKCMFEGDPDCFTVRWIDFYR